MTYSLELRREVYRQLAEGRRPSKIAAVVGVSESVVRYWRAEVGGVIRQSRVSGRYLSREDRYEIARLADAGCSGREIGRRLGRSSGTISRELRRPGVCPPRGRGYHPERAQQAAVEARRRPKETKLSTCPALKAWVQARLDVHDSPEQIAGRLRVEFVDDEVMQISHETIYRAIYLQPRGELRRELRAHLRTGRSRRHPHATRKPRGPIRDAVSIHDRPAEIEDRLIPGHYEGDLMIGPKGTRAAIGTLVERTSGHLTAFHLPIDHTAEATTTALSIALARPCWPVLSLTWDRGVEMAKHADLTAATTIQVYFADPHSPWQRGSNESANGLVREYFPKGLDLATITDTDLQAAVHQLNNRPRKRHGFRTPNEVMAAIMNQQQPHSAATIT